MYTHYYTNAWACALDKSEGGIMWLKTPTLKLTPEATVMIEWCIYKEKTFFPFSLKTL